MLRAAHMTGALLISTEDQRSASLLVFYEVTRLRAVYESTSTGA